MFPPSISVPAGVHPPRARSTDHQLVRRRLGGGESPIPIRSAQFAAAVCQFSVALPRVGTPNSLAPVQYRSRSFAKTAHSFFRRNDLATTANDESRQRPVVRCPWSVVWQRERAGAFTLLELLIVVGIIGLLLVLMAPAFTTIKGGTDVTSAAYTIKGVLDTARTYAKANNTYTWVGLFEEDASQQSTNPATPGPGRLVMSIVASNDGSIIYDPTNLAQQDLTTRLIQVGKLAKIDNVHLWTHTDSPSGNGSTFPTRRNITGTYCIGDTTPANSTTPFGYPVGNPAPPAQYTFLKAIQFSPRGEARINNSTVNANGAEIFPLQTLAEIGLEPTHGPSVPVSIPGNVFAVQFTGIGTNVSIYRR
jgi:type II secretory pathway pseudopilin PulG